MTELLDGCDTLGIPASNVTVIDDQYVPTCFFHLCCFSGLCAYWVHDRLTTPLTFKLLSGNFPLGESIKENYVSVFIQA